MELDGQNEQGPEAGLGAEAFPLRDAAERRAEEERRERLRRVRGERRRWLPALADLVHDRRAR